MLGQQFTFQTFDDGTKHHRDLSRVLHGSLAEHASILMDLNARGAGVFVMVNKGNGMGRKAENVERVRALFVDLDGASLEPVQAGRLRPHCIVESSPGRWHAYWCVSDCPLDSFKPLQQALAEHFNGDSKVCDLPRVMRLPGFEHRKGKPYLCKIVELRSEEPYCVAELQDAFGLAEFCQPIKRAPLLAQHIPRGERNARLFGLARGLVQKGFDANGVNQRLQRLNAERCVPPLCASEVDIIATNASHYGSDGFARLPHKLLDSSQWKGLAPGTHDVILMAFRRYNGTNNGNIALTWADFEGREGFAKKDTFYRYRQAAMQSGILLLASEGRNSQAGRKPDLFAIASQWLKPNVANPNMVTLRQAQKSDLYIDKQSFADLSTTS